MSDLIFNSNQVVKIENKEQFNQIYPFLRSAQKMDLQAWLNNGGYPEFPIYLEHANSVYHGSSIGYIHDSRNTWTNERYEVLSFKDAFKTE